MALRAWLIISGVVLALVAATAGAQTPLPLPEPVLRIDPAMHTSTIPKIGADANCTLLATASFDKTVRLWRLPDGAPLRTLRIPIGPGHEGKSYAIAVAPDASWVAAGGRDAAHSRLGGDFIYVFQVATGAVSARLGPLEGAIVNLAASHDGRFLAATLHRGHGLRVWERVGQDSADWRLVAADKNYSGQAAYGVAFDRAGVLYTAADDGRLRRYRSGYGAPPTSTATREGKLPYSIAVHPSGNHLAVGFLDSRAVEVYNAATLAWQFAPEAVSNGYLSAVAWSADGNRLYAAGDFTRSDQRPLIVWERGGAGTFREVPGPQDTVAHMVPCGDGVAFGSQDPAFGVIAPDGTRRVWREPVQADFRGPEGISIAGDARRIRFGLDQSGKSPVLFDLLAEYLQDASDALGDLAGSDTTSLPITDWRNNRNPRLGSKPLTLSPSEEARSLAIEPSKQRFVLGADWSLRCYDREGKELWHKQSPGVVWQVTIARASELVVAAYGDGTIRWHRLSDGEELLALFVHAKDRRWVAWTPKGYYVASPGAETLIGWHVNRGWNETADFYSVDRFRDQFNRPDIVRLVLSALDEGKAIEEANRRANVRGATEDIRAIAPPVVVVEKPRDEATFSTPEVTFEYYARSPTGKRITDIDVRVNNLSLGARAPLFPRPSDTGPIRLTLTLPPEDVVVTLVAREGNRASEPVSVRLRWDGARPGQALLPRMRALFVGVNAYTSRDLTTLQFAAKDAQELGTFFKGQEGKTYSKVDARVLADAKRADVLKGLEWLEKGSADEDINLLFLAGHGMTDDQQHFYFMAADSEPNEARATGVSRDEILRTIRYRKGAMVVMLDTCYSGASADPVRPDASRVDMNRLVNELGDKTLGVFLYASALGRQFSYEHASWGHGAFTKAMIEGLAGAADREKLGYVETDELAVYVRRRVMLLTRQRQQPVRMKPDAAPEMRLVLLK
jgi:WD40 repeat protein